MPRATRVPCRGRGGTCPALIDPGTGGLCETCRRKRWQSYNHERRSDPNHKANDSFYNSRRWKEYSKWWKETHPFCAGCGELVGLAGRCDHIVPRRLGGADFEESNSQTLCTRCDARKRQSEKQMY